MNLIKETKKIAGIISCDVCLVTTTSDKMYKNVESRMVWEPKWYCISCAKKEYIKRGDTNIDYCERCKCVGEINGEPCPECKTFRV